MSSLSSRPLRASGAIARRLQGAARALLRGAALHVRDPLLARLDSGKGGQPWSPKDRPPERPAGPEGRAPHYGATLAAQIARAEEQVARRRLASAEYKAIRTEFDMGFYLAKYPDIAEDPGIDPIEHYIRHGANEGRDPAPGFSSRIYLARYPEVRQRRRNPFAHWITTGRARGYTSAPFAEFEAMCAMLDLPPEDVARDLDERRADVRARLHHGTLGEMVKKAAAFEPLVSRTWTESFDPKLPPFHSDGAVARSVAMWRLHGQAEFRRADAVILTNRARWGSARRMEGHIADVLAERYGADRVVAVTTDKAGEVPPGKFPDGVRQVDFAAAAAPLGRTGRQRLIVEFLRSLRPQAAFNINSRLMWDAMADHGKALSADMALYASLFCDEQTVHGYWSGYPLEKFYRHFDILTAVLTDSHAMAERLARQYAVPPEELSRIAVLEAPVSLDHPPVAAADRPPGRRPQVFWAGRFDRQKRVDLVFRLAAAMPDADFRVWGGSVLQRAGAPRDLPPNVQLEGTYRSVDEVPLEEADVWLYTAEWDGVPNVLLELSTRGVPIVGSLTGGTGEILRPDLSWPVADIHDVEAYRKAIDDVLADPAAARQRARLLRDAVAAERRPERYRQALLALLP